MSCDVLTIANEKVCQVSREAGALTGIPPADKIIFCSTHTHNGPNMVIIFGMDTDTGFKMDFRNGIIIAISELMENSIVRYRGLNRGSIIMKAGM